MNKNLAYLYSATFISGLGTGMLLVLVNWVILETYSSSALIGGLAATSYFVCFAALPQISIWLDKFSKRCFLMTTYIIATILQFTFVLLIFFGVELIYVLMLSTIISVVVRMTDQMARLSIAQLLADKENIRNVSRQLEIVRQGITLISGAITAWLISDLSMQFMLLIDAITYLVGFLFLLQLKMSTDTQKSRLEKDFQSRLESLKESFIFFKKNRYFFFLMVFSLAIYVMTLAQNALHPAHVEQVLSAGGETYAMIGAVFGFGALIGSVLSAFFHKLAVEKEVIIVFGFFIYLLANIAIMLIPNIWATYICLILFSASHSLIRVERIAFMMEYTPKDKIGRVSGSLELIGLLFVVGVTASVGFIVDLYAVQAAWLIMLLIILSSFICLVITILKVERTYGKNVKQPYIPVVEN